MNSADIQIFFKAPGSLAENIGAAKDNAIHTTVIEDPAEIAPERDVRQFKGKLVKYADEKLRRFLASTDALAALMARRAISTNAKS